MKFNNFDWASLFLCEKYSTIIIVEPTKQRLHSRRPLSEPQLGSKVDTWIIDFSDKYINDDMRPAKGKAFNKSS